MAESRRTAAPSAAIAPSILRTMNQRYLLDWLYSNGPATRPQLARDSGLSQPTVFATLANLEQAGLVRPSGQSDEPAGRPALIYEADPTAGAVLAVDLGYDWVRIVVTDLLGRQLGKVEHRNTARSSKSLVDAVVEGASQVAKDAGLELSGMTTAVIASPGVYRAQAGRVAYAAQLPGWQRPRLAEELEKRLGLPITIENNINLAALSEYTEGAGQGVSPFAFLHIGTGVGLGMVIDGEVFRGATGAAGEVAFLPLLDVEGATPEDRNRGILEEALGADALVSAAKDAGMTGTITPARVYKEARAGSALALGVVRGQTELLARLLVSLCSFLDPELVVLGGGVGQNLDLLGVGLMDRIGELSPLRPRLAASSLGSDAVVRGAVVHGISLAREAEFQARMASAITEAAPAAERTGIS
ncbi:ROK family protein [Pseudolysinimonas kribbensis]|uniref:ROK family transcriptional regulator n=1 Tax=Pseudolysinimonas kribbensis TaxID=433641 RepID=UPI0031E31902